MKVKSSVTNRVWLEQLSALPPTNNAAEAPQPDPAIDEISRLLSEIVRSKNLIVLAGLGTSMCANNAPTMQALWGAVKDEYDHDHTQDQPSWEQLLEIVHQPPDNSDIEELLSRCKMSESFLEGTDLTTITKFINDAERTIRTKVDFIRGDDTLPVHESFLRRLARRSIRRHRLKLFTTNYDLCYDQAARRAGFVVLDGFTFTQPPFFDPMHFAYDIVRRASDSEAPDYIENLFHLYKIHGSIDWAYDQNSKRITKSPAPNRPLLIYPRNTKYELAFVQPYLEMMATFQTCIRERDTGLLILGFGFNDNHIAEPIVTAIETNLAMNVVVVSPTVEGDAATNPFLARIAGMIDHGDARLGLIAATFEELVPNIPDVTATTELERHFDRLRSVRER